MKRKAIPRLPVPAHEVVKYGLWRRLATVAVESRTTDEAKARALRTLVRRYPGYVLLGLPGDVVDWCRLHRETVEKLGPG